MPPPDPDLELRQAAVKRARELAQTYDHLVPLDRLREGSQFGGQRVSFGSFDPTGVVHIAGRLLREIDRPMLRTGLQGFHGGSIALPRRPDDRPDPDRLELRFERFVAASA